MYTGFSKACWAALGVCLVAGPAYSQPSTTTAIITTPTRSQRELSWAERMFSNLTMEMGTVAKGTKVVKSVTVENLYVEDVTLTGIGTTCGCFHAESDKKVLKTHETATITVEMNTLQYRGERHANLDVTLTFDNSTYKSVRVPLHGFIRTDVEIDPGLLNLGTAEEGRGTSKSVSVRFMGRPGAQIQAVRTNNPLISAKVVERARDYSRTDYDVVVTLDSKAPLGEVRDLLKIVTNDSSNPELDLEVYGKVEPDYVVLPPVKTLGNLRPGVEKTVTIVIRGQRPFVIDRLERDSGVDCWRFKKPAGMKSVHTLTMTISPPATPGEYSETFSVTIADRPEPVTFKTVGTIIAPSGGDGTPVAAENPSN